MRYVNFAACLLAAFAALAPAASGSDAAAPPALAEAPRAADGTVPASGRHPTVVFVVLDTTRADRLGAWGYVPSRTPTLDGLAARGIRFAWHFANSHATRPSMPQLMSGRYYHRSILREFDPDHHPREFPFLRPDPQAVLLPEVLRGAGYQLLGASAHPWVVAESLFGRPFERLDLVDGDPSRGHADAAAVVDQALALWRGRDRTRPTFLYVHLMDAHMPRVMPPGEPRPDIPGYHPERRFDGHGEPSFDPRRRRWDRADASDFTEDDRRWFGAVYDANLAFLDRHLARLLEQVTADDPQLARTLVAVTADHGEELGEDGRTDHTDSLVDGVQHVPWILAGAGVAVGRVVDRPTEHVDVVPTLLGRLGLILPAGARVDGVDRLDPSGAPCGSCGNTAVFYAWQDYRAIRTRRHLLRADQPASFRARCESSPLLFDVTARALQRRNDPRRRERMAWHLRHRLDPLLRAFEDAPRNPPARAFQWEARYWSVDGEPALACVDAGPDLTRAALSARGWIWTGRGVTLLGGGASALPLRVGAPDGDYEVAAGAVPVEPMPWLLHFARWARRSFVPIRPVEWIPLGVLRAREGVLQAALPESAGRDRHVLSLRLTPVGAATPAGGEPQDDPELRQRLKALGYVQ